jgi:hypothetical protein
MMEKTPAQNTSFEQFPRLSPIAVALLTVVTLGFYVPYWLYTRTRIIDKIHAGKPVPSLLIALCMGGYIMLLVLAYQLPTNIDAEQIVQTAEFGRMMDAAVLLNIIQLCWAFLFLQRINVITGAKAGDPLHGSYFILVLAHLIIVNVFYLQYKINQIVDTHHKTDNIIGLM